LNIEHDKPGDARGNNRRHCDCFEQILGLPATILQDRVTGSYQFGAVAIDLANSVFGRNGSRKERAK